MIDGCCSSAFARARPHSAGLEKADNASLFPGCPRFVQAEPDCVCRIANVNVAGAERECHGLRESIGLTEDPKSIPHSGLQPGEMAMKQRTPGKCFCFPANPASCRVTAAQTLDAWLPKPERTPAAERFTGDSS